MKAAARNASSRYRTNTPARVLVDAKNDRVAQWYAGYGALALLDAPLSLVLPLAVAADALKRGAAGKR